MRIGIVTVRDVAYHPNRRLLEAAEARGHQGQLIHPYHSWPAIRKNQTMVIDPRGQGACDVLLPRQGAEVGESSLALIEHFERTRVPVVNTSTSIRLARNQYLTLRALAEAGIPVPDSVLINSQEALSTAVDAIGGYPVVLKHPSGRQGEGIRLADTPEDGRRQLTELLDPRLGVMVQRFIPPEDRRDIRVLTVGRKMAGAMALRPAEGDFRANFHLTGRSRPVDVWPEMEDMATGAAAALDLEIAGVDLLVDSDQRLWIIEVNYAPGFRGLEAATGLDVAGIMVDYIVDAYGQK